ncbi:MAG: flippase [Pseudomonadales bacterium]
MQGVGDTIKRNGLRAELFRGGVGSVLVRLTATSLGFVVAVILARSLGPATYGIYTFILALLHVLATPAVMGLPQLMVRETATAQADENWGLMRGLWRWCTLTVVIFSIAIAILSGIVVWLLIDQMAEPKAKTLLVGLLLVPFLALAKLRGAALSGLRFVVLGQLPESIIRPALLVLLVLLCLLVYPESWLTAVTTMSLHVVSTVMAFVVGTWLLWRLRPVELTRHPKPLYQSSTWIASAVPLAMIAGVQIINQYTDILMLGFMRTDAEVGVYRVVGQTTMLVLFGLHVVNRVVAPHFARMHNQGDADGLQRLVTLSARAVLAFALPVVLVFLFYGRELLVWIFGEAYGAGYAVLAILAVGQLVNASFGSVGYLLNMTGHERDTLRGVMVAAIANILLNLVLIPLYGIEGAALATATTMVVWNVILWWAIRLRLGINSSAIGTAR